MSDRYVPYPMNFASPVFEEKEFYNGSERIDMKRLKSIWRVTDNAIPDKVKFEVMFDRLATVFAEENITQKEMAAMMEACLLKYDYIKTRK